MDTGNLLASAGEMQALDRKTIEEIGIPGAVLMENAGRATVAAMERHFGPAAGKRVIIFAGPGNNGGDGLVMARCLADRGALPSVLLVGDPARLPPDAARNWAILERLQVARRVIDPNAAWPTDWQEASSRPLHSVVDALFGIGLTRPLSGCYLAALHAMRDLARASACPIVAADMPSGLHSDTGAILGEAVQADLTVTYGLAKPGHLHNGGPRIGILEVADIGIPSQAAAAANLAGRLLDGRVLARLPPRARTSHKGSHGHVLVLAGSTGKSGAAILAAKGVLASGAGLVSCALPAALLPIFATAVAEAMSEPLVTLDHLAHADLAAVARLCAGKAALLIGPGLGRHPETAGLVTALYRERPEPMVVDADALNILAADREALAAPGGPRILCPHPGEMARLLDLPVPELQRDRLASAQKLCSLCGPHQPIVALLKGAGTVVAANKAAGGLWAVNSSGNPGMASGGMGDVLAGVIAGLLAQHHEPWLAACAGVWLHGAAADLLAKERPFGYTAGEVAAALPRLFADRRKKRQSPDSGEEQIC